MEPVMLILEAVNSGIVWVSLCTGLTDFEQVRKLEVVDHVPRRLMENHRLNRQKKQFLQVAAIQTFQRALP